jgi:uncharacterized protein YraI
VGALGVCGTAYRFLWDKFPYLLVNIGIIIAGLLAGFIITYTAWHNRKNILFIVMLGLSVPGYLLLIGEIRAKQTATVTTDAAQATATVTSDALNLRAGPSASHNIVKTLKKGDTLTVTGDKENGWLPVSHNGDTGYVSAEMVSISGGGQATPQQTQTTASQTQAATGGTATAQPTAPAQTATPAVPVKQGTYLIRPRIRAKENGQPLDLWLDRIEVKGQTFMAFYTGSPEGKGGDGRFQLFWYNPEHIKLESLNGDGKKYDVVSVDEDDDSSNPLSTNGFSNTFQGVAGTRFRITSTWSDTVWAFDEFVLGEPD